MTILHLFQGLPAATNPPPKTTRKIITTRKDVTTRKPTSTTRMTTTTVSKANTISKAPIRVTVTSSPGRRITSTTNIPPRPEEEKQQQHSKLPLILGAVIGGVGLIAMVTVITWFAVKKLRSGRIIDGMSPIGTNPYDDDTLSEDL